MSEKMNLIDRLKELDKAATPGPWFIPEGTPNTVYYDEAYVSLFTSNLGTDPTCEPDDAALIVETRNALHKLLAFVDAYDEFTKDASTVDLRLYDRMYDARKALDQE